jgi:hypothetical protein
MCCGNVVAMCLSLFLGLALFHHCACG